MTTHTHPDIIDPRLRQIMANEYTVLRRIIKRAAKTKHPFSDDYICGLYLGIETALRRVDAQQRHPASQ